MPAHAPSHTVESTPRHPSDAWVDVVRRAAGRLSFGSVHVVIHEGQVTQVEVVEKTRFHGADGRRREPRTS